MENNQLTILLVEDTLTLARLYQEYLTREGFLVVPVHTGQDAMDYLVKNKPSAIVLDLLLPDTNGLEILKHAQTQMPDVPVVVVTVNNSIDVAVEAMRKGAYDFIVKPFPAPRLTVTILNALKLRNLEMECTELKKLTSYEKFYGLIGQSASMQAVYRTIEAVAPSRSCVFLEGETGTGKELTALSIHRASPRREKPFIAINCAGLPREQMDSAIFGHVRGGFASDHDHLGAAKAAHGGTLFIDEICDLPMELQAKLLRFLQTGEVTPTGSSTMDILDVRVIVATTCNPVEEIREKRLREDLYYRLHVIPIELPPLRERDEDILLLASHFMAKMSIEENKGFLSLSPEVMSIFRHYNWPGNVRQLENVLRHVIVLNYGQTIEEDMLPKDLKQFAEESQNSANENIVVMNLTGIRPESVITPLWLVEKQAILAALDYAGHDVPLAATLLEINASTLYRKLQSWRGVEISVSPTIKAG